MSANNSIKIAPEVRDWFKKTPSETASLIVYFDVGQELKRVEYPYEYAQKLRSIAEQICKKEDAIKRGESVDLTELERDKITLAEIERGVPEKLEASRQEMVAYNRALIKPVWDKVISQLRAIEGVDVYDKDDTYSATFIGIHAKASSLEAIVAIPQVIRIALNIRAIAGLNISRKVIEADKVHNEGYFGTGAKVAVEDTGVHHHPDLVIASERSFVPGEGPDDLYAAPGHGTPVAGVVASRHNTYKGIAPGCSLINAKCGNQNGAYDLTWVKQATYWAAISGGAQIINLSVFISSLAGNGQNDWDKYVDYAVDHYHVL